LDQKGHWTLEPLHFLCIISLYKIFHQFETLSKKINGNSQHQLNLSIIALISNNHVSTTDIRCLAPIMAMVMAGLGF